ncbi:MAG: hypothetical protein VX463_13690 [Pseudomonadota bacterium]|nr:hypothetical protein [Pseudomonadota bacterium]
MTRGPSLRRARLGVGAAVAGLAVAAMVAPLISYADLLGDRGATARWAVAPAASADVDAVAAEPVYELRRRFRDKVAECLGVTAATRPLRLEEMPGRLDLRYGDEFAPALTVDIAAMKAEGMSGDYARRSDATALPDAAVNAVLTAGMFGMFAPDHPCPPETMP